MKINVELAALQYAVDTAMRLAPPVSGNLSFTVKNKNLVVTSVAELGRCTVVVVCKLSGEDEFAVPAQALKDAIKGRSELELVYANSTLTVKSGKYKTELVTVDVVPPDEVDKEETKDWKITAETGEWIRSSLRLVQLKPTVIFSTWIPVAVHLSSKGAFICCYDQQHMNWVSSKEVKGDFDCVLPFDTMNSIIDVFTKSTFTMQHAASYVRVRNKIVDAYLSVPDMKEIPTIAQVRERAKDASSAEGKAWKFGKSDLLVFMDNARAIIGKERAELSFDGGEGLKLEVRTGLGTSKTMIKGKGKGDFKVDYEYFQELVVKAPEEVMMTVVDKSFISLQLQNSSALLALNQ